MPDGSPTARPTVLQVLAPGVLVGVLAGLLDGAWLHLHWDAPDVSTSLLALVSSVGLSTALCVPLWAVLRPLMIPLVPVAAGSRVAMLALGGALALSAIDATVFRGLYASAHMLLGVGTIGLLMLSLYCLVRERLPSRNISAGLLLAAALACWAASFGTSRYAVRSALLRHGNLSSHLVAWAPRPGSPDGAPSCPWPRPVESAPVGGFASESVLLISVDALRADLVADDFEDLMPQLAGRMRGATVFTSAHAPAPRTTYSTYSMITGRFPHRLGFIPATVDNSGGFHPLAPDSQIMLDPRKWKLRHRYPLGDQTPTLAGFLRAEGYRTLTVPTDDGLLPAAGITREFEWNESGVHHLIVEDQVEISPATRVVDAVEKRLADCEPGQPLFAWLHFLDPHDPYLPRSGVEPGASPKARYVSEVRHVDQELGRLFALLDAAACKRPKVVIFTSDHGEAFGEHGNYRHGVSVYDELIRVPLRIWLEGVEGATVSTPVSLTDITPTLLDLLELLDRERGRTFDGRSLAPALDGKTLAEEPLLVFNTSYTSTDDMTWGVVRGSWKLIDNPAHQLVELYQRRDDPGELRNLVDSRPELATDLRCLLGGLAGR